MSPDYVTLAERYVLEAVIAKGGMATVWRARDEVLARTVAVKVLHPHLAGDEDFLARFRREALAAARLTHPRIVAIYDTGQETTAGGVDASYVVMEHCGQGSLAERLTRSGPIGPEKTTVVGIAVCEALAHSHTAGILHRDLKPANVLICEDGSVKVGDFGIAQAAFAGGDLTTTSSILGTVTYLSPEQLAGQEPDERSDIYSLGALLYELVAGRPPFVGDGQLDIAIKHRRETPPALRSLRVGVPRRLEAVVRRSLAKDPHDRFGSAEEMMSALQGSPGTFSNGILDTDPGARAGETSESPAEGGGQPIVPQRLLPVILGVLVAVALAFLIPSLLLGDGEEPPGPARDAPEDGPAAGASPAALDVALVADFDPHGGDGEHPEEVSRAVDGDAQTAWTTSSYADGLAAIDKPGVGLLLDLGRAREIERVLVESPSPGYSFELRAGSDLPDDETSLGVVERVTNAPSSAELRVGAVRARYWLVWITSLPGGAGGSAQVAEVSFFGS